MDYGTFGYRGKIIFGRGSLAALPGELKTRGWQKIFIVADPGLIAAGILPEVETALSAAGLDYTTYTGVEPDPSEEVVNNGLSLFVKGNYEALLAIGGGSAMDTAKGIAIVGKSGRTVGDFAGYYLPVEHTVPPLAAIPTTAGTGSEVTRNAVITDRQKYKMVLLNEVLQPALAILDPDLLATLPAPAAAAAGMDALIHAAEAYISRKGSLFTDGMAEKAMELIGPALRPFVARRSDSKAAENMLAGSTFAGLALDHAFPGQAHALSHPVTGFFNIPHGVANAILFPYVLEFNALADQGKYEQIYKRLKPQAPPGSFEPSQLVDAVRALNRDIGLPGSFAEVGVPLEAIDKFIPDSLRTRIYNYVPRETGEKEIRLLYARAITGQS